MKSFSETFSHVKWPVTWSPNAEELEFIFNAFRKRRPAYAIEVGTGAGSVTLAMHEASPETHIVTYDKNPQMLHDWAYPTGHIFNSSPYKTRRISVDFMRGDSFDAAAAYPRRNAFSAEWVQLAMELAHPFPLLHLLSILPHCHENFFVSLYVNDEPGSKRLFNALSKNIHLHWSQRFQNMAIFELHNHKNHSLALDLLKKYYEDV